MFEKSHKFILNAALNSIKDKEMIKYKAELIRGIVSPDRHFKVVHHFYSPQEKHGIKPFGNAKARGVKCFREALKLYTKDKQEAYFLLGNSLHYLADLAVPAHSKLVVHIFETDELEIYLDKVIDKIKIEKIIVWKKNPENYFVDLARLSSKLKTEKNSAIISIIFKITNRKKILPEKELKKQSAKITGMAVAYSAGLIRLFIQSKKELAAHQS